MNKNIFLRGTALTLALLLCLMTCFGSISMVKAVGEEAEVRMISFPRDGEANYEGWGHPEMHYMNGWIDDYHMEVTGQTGSTVYHICEFAEVWEQNGCTEMIPLRKSLPEKCFGFLEASGELIVIEKGKRGYSPTGIYPQDHDIRAGVDAANDANGVTKAQAAAMMAGSMFGWDAPAADPANYDDQGIPIRPGRKQDRGDAR